MNKVTIAVSLFMGALIATSSAFGKAAKTSAEDIEKTERAYQECALTTERIASEVRADEDYERDLESPSGILFEDYLDTIKFDSHGCFAAKDVKAAKRLGMNLEQYVIGGLDASFAAALAKVFVKLETLECAPGIKCKPGITSAFRDNERQRDAVGMKASACNSHHGGTCRTKGYAHGFAADIVNASLGASRMDQEKSTEKLWEHVDEVGKASGIYRPMSFDPPHVEPYGALREKVIAQSGRSITTHAVVAHYHKKHGRKHFRA
jgi:hypothetical protein